MRPEHKYLENKILTASKEELLLMLLDGAIRFSTLAKAKLIEKEYEEYCRLLIRSQNIVTELINSMDPEGMPPQIFENLRLLYQSINERLSRANLQKDEKLVDEALRLLTHLRETWALAIDQDHKTRFPQLAAVQSLMQQEGGPTAPSGLNVEG